MRGFPPDRTVFLVDVYVVRRSADGWEVLLLRRAPAGRSPGSWEAVHGHVEPGETPADAAWREVLEETGLTPERLYNLSRVETFYLHRRDRFATAPAFAATVSGGEVVLDPEHDRAEWLALDRARARLSWPRSRRALADLRSLIGPDGAGALEDVLRVR